jgi:hypothetical protein
MITPDFENYSGSQAIITSDRVINHSKSDGVYLFGKATVGISSPGTINVDSREAVLIDSPKIELGHAASTLGDQVILGNKLVGILNDVLTGLSYLATVISVADGNNKKSTSDSLALLAAAGVDLVPTLKKATEDLAGVLSNTTYTT